MSSFQIPSVSSSLLPEDMPSLASGQISPGSIPRLLGSITLPRDFITLLRDSTAKDKNKAIE